MVLKGKWRASEETLVKWVMLLVSLKWWIRMGMTFQGRGRASEKLLSNRAPLLVNFKWWRRWNAISKFKGAPRRKCSPRGSCSW